MVSMILSSLSRLETATKYHGCRFDAEGAISPASMISLMSCSLMGVFLYFLTDLLPIMASLTFMLYSFLYYLML